MSMKDVPQDYVEFTHPGGHLLAKVVVPSVGQNEAPVIREQIVSRLGEAAKGKSLIIDLSQVSLVSSLGLGTFVDLRNNAEKAGLRPVVYGLNRHLLDLFRLMKIERLFTMLKSPNELDELTAG
jgi:anti-anti-sigma factor